MLDFVPTKPSEEPQQTCARDDGCGFGDLVACCPVCGKVFSVPLEVCFSRNKPESYPCSYCGQKIFLK